MARRLFLTMLGIVVVALAVTGVGTLGLARLGAREATEEELRTQAAASAALLQGTGRVLDSLLQQQGVPVDERPGPQVRLQRVRRALQLENFSILVMNPAGDLNLELGEALPAGLTLADLDLAALRAE